ncbi:MAG: L-histidine N(alpha)-methyltransferase [Acidobacteriota bacterium]|nr:L-histidine N(alpha)-methyltransferase [Acidobacteriota bacterium]
MMLPEALEEVSESSTAVAQAVWRGLVATPRSLPPWLFYDATGSALFEQITQLPEYYLTRAERSIFARDAAAMLQAAAGGRRLTVLELGAGSAAKTGLLLAAALRQQASVLYQPIDVSPTVLALARQNLEATLPGVAVEPHLADYSTQPLPLHRPPDTRAMVLFIGSSIGNFTPQEAVELLARVRRQLAPGDTLLLGYDLAPGAASPQKSVATLVAAYDDAAGVTAAFNRNLLARLNRELGADFNPAEFAHVALWNEAESRMEMHLQSTRVQTVRIPASGAGPELVLPWRAGERIHTENSYKYTRQRLQQLLAAAGFAAVQTWQDEPLRYFAVTLAAAV